LRKRLVFFRRRHPVRQCMAMDGCTQRAGASRPCA
jgi:hypothetical protein